jgi:adenylate kinase
LKVYEQDTAPLLAYYRDRGLLHRVDGAASIDAVAANLERALSAVRSA